MKIFTLEKLHSLVGIDDEIKCRMVQVIEVLNEEYGVERNQCSHGGYVLIINESNTSELIKFLDTYPHCLAEYVELFKGTDGEEYCEILILLSCDDSVIIYLPVKLLNEFKERLGGC